MPDKCRYLYEIRFKVENLLNLMKFMDISNLSERNIFFWQSKKFKFQNVPVEGDAIEINASGALYSLKNKSQKQMMSMRVFRYFKSINPKLNISRSVSTLSKRQYSSCVLCINNFRPLNPYVIANKSNKCKFFFFNSRNLDFSQVFCWGYIISLKCRFRLFCRSQ